MPDTATPEQTNQPTSQELQQVIDQVATSAALADPNVPIEIKLKTGQVYKGMPKDVLSTLARSQEEASELIRQQKDELERLRVVEREAVARQPVDTASDDKWNPVKYFEIWQTDPLKADEYKAQFDPRLQAIEQSVARNERQNELDQFKSTVKWFNPEASEATAFANEFVRSGLQPSKEHYELVYYRMLNQGKIKAGPISGMESHQAPPPSLSGRAGSAPTGIDLMEFEKLPAAQQAEVIERLRQQGWR